MRDLIYQIFIQLLQNIFDAVKKYEVFGSGVLLFALFASMPALIPKSAQDMWTWIRSTLQAIMPIQQHIPLPQTQVHQEKTPETSKTDVSSQSNTIPDLPKLD